MNHELNAQVAEEVMKSEQVHCARGGIISVYLREDGRWRNVPDFSGSLDAAWQMEREIERRGLRYHYVLALLKVLNISYRLRPPDSYGTNDFWKIAHATPEQRCEAALSAVKENS